MWRIIQNAVATKENLFVGKCSHSPFCPICELEVESVEMFVSIVIGQLRFGIFVC